MISDPDTITMASIVPDVHSVFVKMVLFRQQCDYSLKRGEFHRSTATVRVSVRIKARFSVSDRVGIRLSDVD